MKRQQTTTSILLPFLGTITSNTKAELEAFVNDLGLEVKNINRVQDKSSLVCRGLSSLPANNRRIAS